jgi:hypothetical protein
MLKGTIKTPPVGAIVRTFGLWLVTAVLAFFEIIAVRTIVFNVYARLVIAFNGAVQTADHAAAIWLGQASVLVMTIVAIVITIGGFEYHRRHVGQSQSMRFLLWTLGIQIAILLVYSLV